jgi:5-methylcytosine-specific restriction endonuclease McrA
MARCERTWGLEVHHIRRDGGNSLSNAQVLCQECHEATKTYGESGPTPPPFDEWTKQTALANSDRRCECTRTSGCH